MIIPAKCVCDFCGAENPKFKGVHLPVITCCEWTEGRGTQPRIDWEKYDICEECMLLATNIHADFQGSNPCIEVNGKKVRGEWT